MVSLRYLLSFGDLPIAPPASYRPPTSFTRGANGATAPWPGAKFSGVMPHFLVPATSSTCPGVIFLFCEEGTSRM